MIVFIRPAATLAAALAMAGCASLPRERVYDPTRELIARQRPLPANWSPLTELPAPGAPTVPLSVDDAVRLAFLYNPRIREQYARLGLGQAELEDARRITNPGLDIARLSVQHGEGRRVTGSLVLALTDVLLLGARKRLADAELQRLQQDVAATLLDLATEVEVAWYAAVGAEQVAAMRRLVARASEQSGELAQRYFDAGNISRLQLEQELAAATQARINAMTSEADALRARHALAALVGLTTGGDWTMQSQLPSPLPVAFSADALVSLALTTRLDLTAARQGVSLQEDALGVTRRWRWLGQVGVGYEHEHETDGTRQRGASIALALPLFNQGQGALARAQSELLRARAELDAKLLAVHNDVQLCVDALNVAGSIAARYRDELTPRREAIVAHVQEQGNFMLVGVFELLSARQQQYAAYQAYLEAVRDYWIARAHLRGAVGGRLPDDDAPLTPSVGVDAMFPAQEPAHEHAVDDAAPEHEHPPEHHHHGDRP